MRRICLIAVFLLNGLAFAGAGAASSHPSVDEILRRALETTEAAGRKPESDFQYKVLRVSQKLNSDGTVKETERQLFRSIPMGDRNFERLVEENGQPLTPERRREEDRRQSEFEEKLKKGEGNQGDDDGVVFDEYLVSKYDFRLAGVVDVNGRPAYALAYTPKSGDLPVNRRMDRALNKTEGTIYVDRETYQISQVEFELKEKVRIGWGIIGSISQLRGRVELIPIEDGVWLPKNVEIYLNGRILFSSLHRRETVAWSDFERLREDSAPSAQAQGLKEE